jgi:hypothetical protein
LVDGLKLDDKHVVQKDEGLCGKNLKPNRLLEKVCLRRFGGFFHAFKWKNGEVDGFFLKMSNFKGKLIFSQFNSKSKRLFKKIGLSRYAGFLHVI